MKKSRRLNIVGSLRVESPCSNSWAQMDGDTRRRFCEDCGKHVHNVSEMTRSEVAKLLRASGGHCCMRITMNADSDIAFEERSISVRLAKRFLSPLSILLSTTLAASGAFAEDGSHSTSRPGYRVVTLPAGTDTSTIRDADYIDILIEFKENEKPARRVVAEHVEKLKDSLDPNAVSVLVPFHDSLRLQTAQSMGKLFVMPASGARTRAEPTVVMGLVSDVRKPRATKPECDRRSAVRYIKDGVERVIERCFRNGAWEEK